MRFNQFVQSGNTRQAHENGMGRYVYSFAGRNTKIHNDFSILDEEGQISGAYWTIGSGYATSFKLELIMHNTKKGDIPFIPF